jgi:hypothetical protein
MRLQNLFRWVYRAQNALVGRQPCVAGVLCHLSSGQAGSSAANSTGDHLVSSGRPYLPVPQPAT